MSISVLALEKNNQRLYITGLPTDENGEWLVGLPAGKYIVLFKDLRDSSNPYAAQWYGNSVSEESATTVDLTKSITENKNINAVLKQGFALRG
jgi:ribosomal protein S11